MPLFCLSQRKTKSILRYDNDLFVKYFTFNIFYWDWHKSCYEYYMIKRNKFTINNLWHIYIISLKLSVDSIPMNDKKLNKGQKKICSLYKLFVCVPNLFSPVWLFVTPWTVVHQISCIHWILQARMLVRVATPSSRGSSWPRDWRNMSLLSPELAGEFFTISATWESLQTLSSPVSGIYCSRFSKQFGLCSLHLVFSLFSYLCMWDCKPTWQGREMKFI